MQIIYNIEIHRKTILDYESQIRYKMLGPYESLDVMLCILGRIYSNI